ncbi:hypothetical protein DFQ30_008423, partial [Apophysomyces sp. BC1015]
MECRSVRSIFKEMLSKVEYEDLQRLRNMPKFTGTSMFLQLLKVVESEAPSATEIDRPLRTKLKYADDFHSSKEHEFCTAKAVIRHLQEIVLR